MTLTLVPDPLDIFAELLDPSRTWWSPQPKQQKASDLARLVDELLYGGAAGGGKAGRCPDRSSPSYDEALETHVLTPKGFVAMQDVKVGQQVCNPDGTVARVLAVHERGRLDFFTVTLADGSKVEATADHLWVASTPGVRKRRRATAPSLPAGLRPEDEWNLRVAQRCRVATTTDLLEATLDRDADVAAGGRGHGAQVPLTAPVAMTGARGRWPTLPAYTIGVLLGDGSIGGAAALFGVNDPEIADQVRAEVEPLGLRVTERSRRSPEYVNYAIVGRPGARKDSPPDLLRRDGLLGKRAWEKAVPRRLMVAPVEDRRGVLQGLMDTDGHMDERGHVEFTSCSEQLALDVQYLARSLGARATLTSKPDTWYRDGEGEKVECRPVWRVYVQGPRLDLFFRLPRKAGRARPFNGGDVWPSNRVVSVVPSGTDRARCITVDNPNGLYVTDDFVVTHNSIWLVNHAFEEMERNPGNRGVIFRRVFPSLTRTVVPRVKAMCAELLPDGRPRARYNANDHSAVFPNGSTLELASLERSDTVFKYSGAEYGFIGWEELTEFLESQYLFLLTRLRAPVDGVRPHMASTTNPGGVGHVWVKRRFVKPKPVDLPAGAPMPTPMQVWRPVPTVEQPEPLSRAFVPATLDDNPALTMRDPGYLARLRANTNRALRKALESGDWDAIDAVEGALWEQSWFDAGRVDQPSSSRRRLLAIDTSDGEADGDGYGVCVASLGNDGRAYVEFCEEWTGHPNELVDRSVALAGQTGCDLIVVEKNHGGKWVPALFGARHRNVTVKTVWASEGKRTRAEPVAGLFEPQDGQEARAVLVGHHPDLEAECTTFTGRVGEASPNRLDAMVWAVTKLMLEETRTMRFVA